MRKETSPKKDADVRPSFVGRLSNAHAGSLASASFAGLREDRSMDAPSPRGCVATSDNVSFSSEDTDRYVASGTPTPSGVSELGFRILAESALEQGHISAEGLERVMHALYGGAQ